MCSLEFIKTRHVTWGCKKCLVLAEMNEALCDIEYNKNKYKSRSSKKIILMS